MKDSAPPHVLLQLSALKIFICFKLSLFKSATEELSRLGDLGDMSYQFESFPSIYPSLHGSFVPFSLRVLQAELPSYQGNSSLTIDSLYGLLSLCKEEITKCKEVQEKMSAQDGPISITEVDELMGGALPLPNFLNPLQTEWDPDPALCLSG